MATYVSRAVPPVIVEATEEFNKVFNVTPNELQIVEVPADKCEVGVEDVVSPSFVDDAAALSCEVLPSKSIMKPIFSRSEPPEAIEIDGGNEPRKHSPQLSSLSLSNDNYIGLNTYSTIEKFPEHLDSLKPSIRRTYHELVTLFGKSCKSLTELNLVFKETIDNLNEDIMEAIKTFKEIHTVLVIDLKIWSNWTMA